MEKVSFGGWANCYRLANGQVELIATADVGPRLIHFGLAGGPNEFVEFPAQIGKTGGDVWRLYGGHRLWHAPEDVRRTYVPDNDPVAVEPVDGGLRLRQPVEASTGIEKEIEVRLWPDAPHARVIHRLTNRGPWPVTLAPWALSAMAAGGTAIVPLPPRGTHPEQLAPSSTLTLWPYTDLTDARWTWGRRFVLLRQDSSVTRPQKVGALVPDGWAAHAREGRLFVKTFDHRPGSAYPDLGSAVEVFANAAMLELETLGPMTQLAPGATVEHSEEWWLFDGVRPPASEADVEASIEPIVRRALRG